MQLSDYYRKWKVKLPQRQQYPQFGDSLYYFVNGDNKAPVILIVPFRPTGSDTAIGYYERKKSTPGPVIATPRTPLLTVHGNVMYDLFYQSNVDTPYVQKDVYQHTVQTSLVLTYKDRYPLRINFTTRMGNSSLFRNLTDFNLQFTSRDFKNAMLQRAKGWDAGKYAQLEELEKLRAQMEAKQQEINRLKGWKADPALLQRMVEARERAYYGRIKDSLAALNKPDMEVPDLNIGKRGLGKMELPDDMKDKGGSEKEKADSAVKKLTNSYEGAERKLDSLQGEMAKLQALYKKQEDIYNTRKGALADILIRSKNNKELAENLKAANLPDTMLPKGYKHLLAIRSVGIGRTLVNYSELTAKDISILGVQAEYNPSYYVAFATGRVDYRFRDFLFNENRSRQYLTLMRAGLGMRDGNNLIVTYYTGKKQVYNFNTAPGGSTNAGNLEQRIMGFSLEGRWQLNENNYIIGEAAKSSLPTYARSGEDHSSALGSVFKLDDHSNEAYSVKASSFWPQTGTKINGMYKMMGANFQSFSLFTTGSSQTAWSIRVDQPFFKQQLTISGSIKKNDFTTNYQQTNYQSNTVFKSIQATFRRKKWPVITVGYYPSSQITKLSDNSYSENLFYNLVGTASHFYTYRGIMMSTVFSYTQFYNKQTDSNFLYFNSKNMMLNQTLFVGKFTINGGGSFATNPEYNLYGADGNVQYKMRTWLEIGGGMKYNFQTVYDLTQIGYSGNARVIIPLLGEIAVMAEKAFIPGMEKRLVSSNNGRLTYTKTF
ncbi:coiled-coil domain-containing protein [Chitinophaga ginsengisoli]|uniref:Uncharacterized protein n=1 Tax=Chitinophaga ginsengisoli TaxID=363837 RepID=A0A2P8FX57_9BACT|nr:hypothetical protein [Chitinophaga ginsengisoli]PSL26299.1 hypothetical protein CLV42_11110 [Chitinophaga ginsengisoli]